VPHRHQWYFACLQESRKKSKVRRFEEWLAKQVASDPALSNYKIPGKAA
jgi:hypothetical protein